MFDLERVEVLRGPQGTLFGRNTPAGIVKFDTRKPTQEFGGDAALSYGELGSMSFEGAVGGGLTDAISFRLSALYQERDDWIDNTFTGENDAMGGYDEFAYRAQLLIEPSDAFSALLNIHGRDIDGTASIFRANVLGPGSDGFNSNYDRDSVSYDERRQQPAERQGHRRIAQARLRLWRRRDADVRSPRTRTTESSQPRRHRRRLRRRPTSCRRASGPARRAAAWRSVHPVPVRDSMDGIDDLDQLTQEFRIASQANDRMFWQAGAYYFDSEFSVTTNLFNLTPAGHSANHGDAREHGLGRVRPRQLRRDRRA